MGHLIRSRDIGKIVFAISLVFLLTFVLGKHWPIGPDYFYTFRQAGEAWLRGETSLYEDPHFGYFAAPWGLFLIIPTLIFPIQTGQALISVFSLIGLIFAVHVFIAGQEPSSENTLIVVLAVANLHTFDMLLRGNVDAVPVVGLALAFLGVRSEKAHLVGLGLWLLSVKPINLALAMIVILWLTIQWGWRKFLVCITPLAATVLISFPLFGFDWPIRYLEFVTINPPLTYLQTSLWRGLVAIGLEKSAAIYIALPILVLFVLTIRRFKGLKPEWQLSLSSATNLTVSPYTLGSHYTILAPVFALLAKKSKWYLLFWFLTLVPLVRLVGGGGRFELAWLDIVYPAGLLVACFGVIWASRSQTKNTEKEMSPAA